MIIQVENLKCAGCVSSVNKALSSILGVQDVKVDLESGFIEITGHADLGIIVNKLSEMGYPELGNNTFIAKTKSYVSCAIGKMNH
jgi:copper chaperone CopZ